MGYYNPILAYGLDAFMRDAASAGVDGLIVVDLPPEESADVRAACLANNLRLIYLLAPTSTDERIKLVAESARRASSTASASPASPARATRCRPASRRSSSA